MSRRRLTLLLSAVTFLAHMPQATAADGFLDQVLKDIAEKHLSEQKFNQLQEFTQRDPKNSQAHICLGLALDQLGLTEEAAAQFELAVRYGADNPRAVVELCKQWIRLGQVEAAKGLLNEGAKKFPRDPEMLYLVGDFLLQEKRRGDAQLILKEAMDINPDIPGLPTAYGASLMDINPSSAATLASIDLQKNPKNERALRVRGFSYRILGEYAKAAKDLQIVFDRLPIMPNTAEALSDCYYWMGAYKQAVRPAVFLVAFTSFPDVEQSGNVPKLVRILAKLPKDQIKPAVFEVEKEISARYSKPEFHYCLGKAFDQVDLQAAAMDEYKKAISIDPKYVQPYYRLARDQELYARDYEAALENYKTAHTLRPWDQEVEIAYLRLDDRLSNKRDDAAWKWKDWLSKTFGAK